MSKNSKFTIGICEEHNDFLKTLTKESGSSQKECLSMIIDFYLDAKPRPKIKPFKSGLSVIGEKFVQILNLNLTPEEAKFIQKLKKLHRVNNNDVVRVALKLLKETYYKDLDEKINDTDTPLTLDYEQVY